VTNTRPEQTVKSFYRRLRLEAYFSSPQESGEVDTSQTPDRSENTTLESLKPKTSHWTPPPGKFGSLDYYITKCRSEVNKLNFKQRLVKNNLTPEERAALISLRQRADIVIKTADKGGAVVVWDRNLYQQEAERQLSDNTFYVKLDRDFTMDYNKTICEVVKEAITKGELPASAVNLIVENPRTGVFTCCRKSTSPVTLEDLLFPRDFRL